MHGAMEPTSIENKYKPVLLIGGTGVIGSRAARTLRNMHPTLPLTITGRELDKAVALAEELGRNADAVPIDISKPGLGLPHDAAYSAIAIFMKDDSLRTLRFAQAKGIPYVDISTAVFEIGPEVATFIQHPTTAPVLMNSNWLAGTSTHSTLYFAQQFESIESITISALLDSEDIGGAAAEVDYERQTGAVTSALALEGGLWRWLDGDAKNGNFQGVDGTEYASQAFGNLDVLSLATATDAQSVKFEFAVGETASRRQGKHFSHEIIITITGTKKTGQTGTYRYAVVHPEGQAPMTALGAAVAVERLVGLSGSSPVEPGLYLPHKLIDPGHMAEALRNIGAELTELQHVNA